MHRFIWTTIVIIVLCLSGGFISGTANPGNPVIKVSTSLTDEAFVYRRWVAVFNRTDAALDDYPLEITSLTGSGFDHAALVSVGKAQADGDDLRVEIDGSEVDHWIVDANTANTKLWINLTLQPQQGAILAEGFGGSDILLSLAVDDTSGFPASGLLFNGSSGEAFTYSSSDGTHFLGVSRAARSTFTATANSGDEIVWIEHDVYLLYGNDAIGAPIVNDHYQPSFTIATSSNITWDYDYFGENDGLRTASWSDLIIAGAPIFYTGYHGGLADPWSHIGIEVNANERAAWDLYNPCGITYAVVSGDAKREGNAWTVTGMKSSIDGITWASFYSLSTPLSTEWFSWSADNDTVSGARYMRLLFIGPPQNVVNRMDLNEATLTLDSVHTPGVFLSAERSPVFLPLIIQE
jgi:hypothetical protein